MGSLLPAHRYGVGLLLTLGASHLLLLAAHYGFDRPLGPLNPGAGEGALGSDTALTAPLLLGNAVVIGGLSILTWRGSLAALRLVFLGLAAGCVISIAQLFGSSTVPVPFSLLQLSACTGLLGLFAGVPRRRWSKGISLALALPFVSVSLIGAILHLAGQHPTVHSIPTNAGRQSDSGHAFDAVDLVPP